MVLLGDIFIALSRSIDLVNRVIGSHSKRVAYIAGRLAYCLSLPARDITGTVVAAGFHDIGALKESEYKELVSFDYQGGIDYHSLLGYRLLNSCEFTKGLAEIVKYHHVNYNDKKEINSDIRLLSDIIHLSDRIDVSIDYTHDILKQKDAICGIVQKYTGDRFDPDIVQCFLKLAKQEAFWLDLQFNDLKKFFKNSFFYNPMLTLEQIHDIAKLFTKIIDFRSRYTATHSSSVAMVAKELGRLLHLSERECLLLDIAGHLHDIGKLAIPISILEKPDKLTADEWRVMKQHTYFTFKILEEIDDPFFKVINEWASFHHERLDGEGYPFKIQGNEITFGSRIVAVADMFTALAESRPYRDAMDDGMIIDTLKKLKGSVLDPAIVDVAIAHYNYLKDVRMQAFCDAVRGFEDLFDSGHAHA